MDVLRTLTDTLRPYPGQSGQRWAEFLDRAASNILEHSINLDPALDSDARRRMSDGRSIWIEPIGAHHTSEEVLAQEERILTWPSTNNKPHRNHPSPSRPDGSTCCNNTPHGLSPGLIDS